MNLEITGLGALIILILDVWAIVSVLQSKRRTLVKVVWILVILLLPLIGLVAWLIFGPRSRSAL